MSGNNRSHMIKELWKIVRSFLKRMQEDHMGAYAATCAYFIMISFVPLLMVILSAAAWISADTAALTEGLLGIVPDGLKSYVGSIISEVQLKSHAYLPGSLVILLWSASKFFHSLSNGLDVISKVGETRGWFFIRLRSMLYILVFVILITVSLLLSFFGPSFWIWLTSLFPDVGRVVRVLYSFRALLGYFGLIFVFLFIYKFLPNCHYTLKSQFPGALVVATIWMFASWLISLYYSHNRNFRNVYGSLTGLILAMIWLYFCCYFLYLGAELNRVFYEDPDNNMVVQAIDVMKDASIRKERIIAAELDEHSVWKPIRSLEEAEIPSMQPRDIDIPWADENVPAIWQGKAPGCDFYSRFRKPGDLS